MSSKTDVKDFNISSGEGGPYLGLLALISLVLAGVTFLSLAAGLWVAAGVGVVSAIIFFSFIGGFYTLEPNQMVVMSFFGNYKGTVEDTGLRWSNPFYNKEVLSSRINNFESSRLKVNDLDGSPIEIGAVVVWRIREAARAVFSVEDYSKFVHLQAESALRILASHYAYDSHQEKGKSLRDNQDEVSIELQRFIQERLSEAGVEVVEARISHLAYAPEIAQAMLQRQQASAVVAARAQIVAGAVGTVEMALKELEKNGLVTLDDERKAQMVSNLLVVLCSDRSPQPVVNTGSIHS